MMGVCGAPTPVQGVQNGVACPRSTDVWGLALDSSCRAMMAWPTSAAKSGNGIVTGKLPQNGAPPGSTDGLPGASPGTFVTTQVGGPDLCGADASLPGGSQAAPFQVASGVQGAPGSGCLDKLAPVSRFRGRVRATRRGLRLAGHSYDLACAGGRAGRHSTATLRTIRVAIARRLANRRCRFMLGNGRFGAPVSCLRTTYITASGRSRWTLRVRARLPRGRYVAWVRGIDAFGNVERKARRRNLIRFRVR